MRISDWISDVCSSDLIDMGAAVVLVREDHLQLGHHGLVLRLFGSHQAGEVIAVAERHIDLAGRHGADLAGIAALGLEGEIRSEERRGGQEWGRRGRFGLVGFYLTKKSDKKQI